MTVPDRFFREVTTHLALNFAEVAPQPLLLGIFGAPGEGKTYQLRLILAELGIHTHSINAADLESDRAGQPGKQLLETYVVAARAMSAGRPTALVVDDVDTTVGEWTQNTGTVNHQQVLAQLMHLADSPGQIEQVGQVRRVPVFVTGNDFSKLYPPLRRPGRMVPFHWEPTADEKIAILESLLEDHNSGMARELVMRYPNMPVAFFAQVHFLALRHLAAGLIERMQRNLKAVVEDPNAFRRYLEASWAGSAERRPSLLLAAEGLAQSQTLLEASFLVKESGHRLKLEENSASNAHLHANDDTHGSGDRPVPPVPPICRPDREAGATDSARR